MTAETTGPTTNAAFLRGRIAIHRWRWWWQARFPFTQLPYRICVPWQEFVAEDGPYKCWRWLGREWFKRPWAEGRTKETTMRYRAMKEAGEGPWAKA